MHLPPSTTLPSQSNLSASSGGLTTPAAVLSYGHALHLLAAIASTATAAFASQDTSHAGPSSGLTSPTPSHGSGRRRDSRSRHDTPPLPVPAPVPAPKPTPAPAPKPKPKRSWAPFRLSGGAASVSTASSRPASPEPTPIMPRGPPYGQGPLIPTSTLASDPSDHGEGGDTCRGRRAPRGAAAARAVLAAGVPRVQAGQCARRRCCWCRCARIAATETWRAGVPVVVHAIVRAVTVAPAAPPAAGVPSAGRAPRVRAVHACVPGRRPARRAAA
ncbi:hypothetical protein EDB86DRAFT_1600580 [Lactarius hatsudake]|nr:hypothetical protein EDB86DRAFT_1600580 [Lactarius hatsudake]